MAKLWDDSGSRAIGRNAANTGNNDNFFTKKAKSIENAVGTTLAVPASFVHTAETNAHTEKVNRQQADERDAMFQKYGFASRDDYYKQLEDSWDVDGNATAETERLLNIPGLNEEEQALNARHMNDLNNRAAELRDYAENNYVSKKISQDRGKFLGSAINTLSTATDLTGLTSGPLANAIQGGIEGVADELEQNGLENFDWGRAGQNAAVGAASGAAVGAFNKGLDARLATNNGKLFAGNNFATRAVNKAVDFTPREKTLPGQLLGNVGRGAVRGAASGAVGGATGAGLSAAMNNQDILSSALQGATQGARQGAIAGGVMSGANTVLSRTPGVGDTMRQLNQANEDWRNSGNDFNERLTNTLTSGDSAVGEWLQGNRQSGVLNRLRSIGGTLQDTNGRFIMEDGKPKLFYHGSPNTDIEDFDISLAGKNTHSGERAIYFTDDRPTAEEFSYERIPTDSMFVNERGRQGKVYERYLDMKNPLDLGNLSDSQIDELWEYATPIAKYDGKEAFIKSIKDIAAHNNDQLIKSKLDLKALSASPYDGFIARMYPNENEVREYGVFDSSKIVNPETLTNTPETPTTLGGWLKRAGTRIVDDINNRGVGLSIKDTGNIQEAEVLPRDIRNIQVNDNTVENPATELYRTVTGETEQPKTTNTDEFLAYGESDLANGKTQKKNFLSKAGRVMERAQVGATRKETRDIGIDDAGELVNRLRQRTGFTDIEDQANFGKELTGGENSLLDKIQRNAIGATEDGSARTVEIDKIIPQVNKLIDEASNVQIKPSQKEALREAIMADLTNGSIDTITKANNFKSAAKQQFIINERTPNDSAKELGILYTKVANLIDDASYAEIPQTQVDAMFETGASEARARARIATKNGKNDVATAYNNLADELDASPKTAKAFRSLKKDYVDINKLNKKTQQGSTAWNNPLTMGTAITAAMMTGNPLTAVPAAWAAKTFAPAIGEGALRTSAKLGGKLADLGDAITNRATKTSTPTPTVNTEAPATETSNNYNPQTQLYNAIGRTEGEIQGENAARGYLQEAAKTTEPVAINNTGNATSTALYNTVNGTGMATTGTGNAASGANSLASMTSGDYYTNLLERALNLALEAGDAPAFASLLGMYQDAVANQEKSTSTDQVKLTDKQRQANAAERALEDMENAENNFAYDVSDIPVIGGIANMRGNDYKSKAEALALQVGYMLSGATVNAQEAKNIGMAYVPQPRESETERKRKLAQLRGIISDYQKTYEG